VYPLSTKVVGSFENQRVAPEADQFAASIGE
jgi:hypothetical protein